MRHGRALAVPMTRVSPHCLQAMAQNDAPTEQYTRLGLPQPSELTDAAVAAACVTTTARGAEYRAHNGGGTPMGKFAEAAVRTVPPLSYLDSLPSLGQWLPGSIKRPSPRAHASRGSEHCAIMRTGVAVRCVLAGAAMHGVYAGCPAANDREAPAAGRAVWSEGSGGEALMPCHCQEQPASERVARVGMHTVAAR